MSIRPRRSRHHHNSARFVPDNKRPSAAPTGIDLTRLSAEEPRGNADPGRTQENDNIERVKCPKVLIEDLDFVNRLERFGQAADWAPPLRNQKFADSPLEGDGFELSLPRSP